MQSSKICLYFLFIIVSSRSLSYLGVPTIINFINFPLVLIVFFIHIKKIKNIDTTLFNLILLLSLLIIFSGIMNSIGVLNVILQILLYITFFMYFITIISTEWDKNNILFFKKGLAGIFIINIIFSYFQIFLQGSIGDNVHGIAINLGTAAHLNGAICLISFLFFMFYYISENKILSYILAFTNLPIIFYSDAKQILLVMAFTWITTLIFNFKFKGTYIKELLYLILGALIFYFVLTNDLIVVRDYNNLMIGFGHKFDILELISEKNTLFQMFFGMGPGQTISRLATESYLYYDILKSYGFTHSNFTNTLISIDIFNYRISGSSFFSMKFTIAGIFGDIGIFGLLSYMLILLRIYKVYCLSQIQKFILISFIYYGLTFTWLEEPIFMILYFSVLGFIWQIENYKNKKKLRNR
jgi:hypothetical protein